MVFALRSTNISAKEALREGVARLQRAHIESASLDARLLLEHVLGTTREHLLFTFDAPLSETQDTAYRELIAKREKRQPVAQLTGKREFWGMNFKVSGATLDPRPDSETLIEALVARCDREAKLRILDLGTGTGCLLLALLKEFPHATGVGVDISEEALCVARENAVHNELQGRCEFKTSDWFKNIEGSFDIIVSNPPYIETAAISGLTPEVAKFEPRLALDGGADGLDCYRAIVAQLPQKLAPEGTAALEIGFGQLMAMEELIASHGLLIAGVKRDLNNIPRCILMTRTN